MSAKCHDPTRHRHHHDELGVRTLLSYLRAGRVVGTLALIRKTLQKLAPVARRPVRLDSYVNT